MTDRPQIGKNGFSIIEVMVALTLIAVAAIGAMSLLASNQIRYYKNDRLINLTETANSMMNDIAMRYAGGADISGFTAELWAGLLGDNGLTPADVTMVVQDMRDFSRYRINTIRIDENYMTVAGGSGVPSAGDIFFIQDTHIICVVETVAATTSGQRLNYGESCNLPGASLVNRTLTFAAYKVRLTLNGQGDVSHTATRQFFARLNS